MTSAAQFSLLIPRRFLLAALLLAMTQSGFAATSSTSRVQADEAAPLTWRLDGGREISASIAGYSRQSRVISLRQINGLTVHVSPRDLTAASKWQWYSSPEFQEVARQHRPAPEGIRRAALVLAGPAVGVFFGAFLSFWAALSMVSGQSRLGRAVRTYLKAAGIFLVIAAAAAFTAQACAMGLSGSPLAGPARDAVFLAAAAVFLLVVTTQVGSDYDLSGGSSFASVAASALFLLLGSGVTLYLLPRLLERPGLDDWVTDRLLGPLGFA